MKIKKSKIIFITFLLVLVLMASNVFISEVMAADNSITGINTIITDMSGVDEVNTENSSIANVINAIIKLIQIAGSGVAVIVVTMLGIKYMLASSGEKADIKKQAMPIVVGCVILFAAVNLVGIVADIGNGLNISTTASS